MRVPETAPAARSHQIGERAGRMAGAAHDRPDCRADHDRAMSENILIDWWEHDCRDNNDKDAFSRYPGRYDEEDPPSVDSANTSTPPGGASGQSAPPCSERAERR